MKRVVLIRHGETDYNAGMLIQGWLNSQLTDKGKDQAREAASKLTETPDIIIASDLDRAAETARIIRQELNSDAPLLLDWRLRERYFGSMQGDTRDDARIDELFASQPDDRPYGAESENALSDRVWSFIQNLELIEGNTIYIVTHNGVINRFGYLLEPGYTHTIHPNGSSVVYDIDPKVTVNRWLERQGTA